MLSVLFAWFLSACDQHTDILAEATLNPPFVVVPCSKAEAAWWGENNRWQSLLAVIRKHDHPMQFFTIWECKSIGRGADYVSMSNADIAEVTINWIRLHGLDQ